MRPETVLPYLDAQPFRRFRRVMNSGRSFEVHHPEMVRVGRDVLLYFYADPPGAAFERWDSVALRLIEKDRVPGRARRHNRDQKRGGMNGR